MKVQSRKNRGISRETWSRYSGARFSAKRVSLSAGPVTLVVNGNLAPYREKDAARVFARERVPLVIDLGGGTATAVVLSSDLGHDYVSLNADYRS